LNGKLTRRRFLGAAGVGATWIALASLPGCEQKQARSGHSQKQARSGHSPPAQAEQEVWSFRSRPDLSPPTVEVTTRAHDDTAPGYIFLAPKRGAGQDGPMIIDGDGQPVWFRPLQREDEKALDFKVQLVLQL